MKGIMWEILSKLAAIACWEGFRRLPGALRRRAIHRFWNLLHDEVVIVYPLYAGRGGKKAPRNMARIEDERAGICIAKSLGKRGPKDPPYGDDERPPSEADLVLVCSPKGNSRSKLFQDKHSARLRYQFVASSEDPDKWVFLDTVTHSPHRSPMDLEGEEKIDIGLVRRFTEDAPRRRVFCFWGIHGIGTLGAAEFSLQAADLRKIHEDAGAEDFEILVEVHFASSREVLRVAPLTPPWIIR